MYLKTTILALAAFTAIVSVADARPAIRVDFGNVGIGYRDVYMGNDHSFHRWEHANDYVSYRRNHRGQYHDWNHDRR